ncbi:MAG: efflux RND transporter permease subunit [Planctomycetota bacterium]
MSELDESAETSTPRPRWKRGPISWMARNPVAANLLMASLVLGGLMFMVTRMKQEVYPEFSIDRISIRVSYPGASPEEVETGIALAVEDAVQGLDGVKHVDSTTNEGSADFSVELLTGSDRQKILQDVKNAVDRIQSFPEEAERPTVSLVEVRNQVCSLIISGDQTPSTLRALAERVRDELLGRDDITLVEIANARPLEVSIEVPRAKLRKYNLTIDGIARTVRDSALELPGGGVRAPGGELLIRVQERRDFAEEFADIPIIATSDGARVSLGQLADLRDGFRETDQEATFAGKPAIKVDVYRVGMQTPQDVSDSVYDYLESSGPSFPDGVSLDVWDDRSEIYRDRIDLLLRNAAIGLALVLLLLGLFLDARLAFWVTVGIASSVIGAFLIIPFTGASINMISLFAFIVTLGIIVDDAIIVGENIYEMRAQGATYLEAAIKGTQEIAGPVVFAVLTNIAAFMPLLFVPGGAGNLFRQIPSVVIAVFVISLIESLFILPAHLAHVPAQGLVWRLLAIPRRLFGTVLEWFIRVIYPTIIRFTVSFRYLVFALALGILLLALGAVRGGFVKFSFLPRIDADVVRVSATLPFGIAIEDTRSLQRRLIEDLDEVVKQAGGWKIVRGVYTQIGEPIGTGSPGPVVDNQARGSHLLGISVQLVSSDDRDISGIEFSNLWRKKVGNLAGLETLSISAESGRGDGAALEFQLSHRDRTRLDDAAIDLAKQISAYPGVKDLDDGVNRGKPQDSYRVNAQGRSRGLLAGDVARQIRSSFFGAEAIRQQRGRNELRVYVRLPKAERSTTRTLEDMMLRTPSGGEVLLTEAADVESGFAYTQIRRRDGRRIVSVTSDVDETEDDANANDIRDAIEEDLMPKLQEKYPGLSYSLEGEQKAQAESLEAILSGTILALMAIYAMLAIPFKSYLQPMIVMVSIPFGVIGALIGHIILGFDLSIISMFGIIALSGVVVNDSMVLIVTANRLRENGIPTAQAIAQASTRRFRPIILTSLTTFFGLSPMIFETSVQARFLVPMAVSLGFGILFATFIILLVVPAIYTILDDISRFFRAFGSTD